MVAALVGCSSNDVTPAPDATDDESAQMDAVVSDSGIDTGWDACPAPPADPVKAMYMALDPARLTAHLKSMSGVIPVNLGDGGMQSITNRYAPPTKAMWRAYFEQYMTSLGIPWVEMPYSTAHFYTGESQGHNIEAVLPGASRDSIIVIIHYDSIGPPGQETTNPGVDDDMTGMASLMEAARLFSQPCLTRQKTIRFVATDYEEHLNPGLEGARVYAKYIKAKAANEAFQLVASIDYEQSGWNCASDAVCAPDAGGTVYDVFDCSGDNKNFKSTALGDAVQLMTTTLGSSLAVARRCMAQNSDHYAMWEIGVPSVVTSEHLPLQNPHFDQNGGDTYDKIDVPYHLEIARLSVAFTAQLAGVGK